MPNIKSQIKRSRKSEEQRVRNKSTKSQVRTGMKRFQQARAEGDLEEAEKLFREASRKLDKAVSKGVMHANKAANEKSRMARQLNQARKVNQ